jgi:hypothetical protein
MGDWVMISRRGHRWGPDVNMENTPSHIRAALECGFWVMVDVWYVNGWIYLGATGPTYVVSSTFLRSSDRVLCWPRSPSAAKYVTDNGLNFISWDGKSSAASVCLVGHGVELVFMVDNIQEMDDLVSGEYWGICSDWIAVCKNDNENKCCSK